MHGIASRKMFFSGARRGPPARSRAHAYWPSATPKYGSVGPHISTGTRITAMVPTTAVVLWRLLMRGFYRVWKRRWIKAWGAGAVPGR